jgi:Tfp pilus assembly protein PilF
MKMTDDSNVKTPKSDSLADQALEAGIHAARSGKKQLARHLLLKVTELDPACEEAWLWLSGAAES